MNSNVTITLLKEPINDKVIFFYSSDARPGDMATISPRDDIDDICWSCRPDPSIQYTLAFISIDGDDSIRNIPYNFDIPVSYPIVTYPNRFIVAVNIISLIKSDLPSTLSKLGVSGTDWWSGSDASGNFEAANCCVACATCTSWTNGSNTSKGRSGDPNKINSWIYGNARNCNNSLRILCLGWK